MSNAPPFLRTTTVLAGLSLSDDTAVESVLTDIPFFSVGLLAFGVFTFFLVMKRVNLLATYLYSSALLAFASAILDLSEILATGRSSTDNGTSLASFSGLIITREIGLALSIGFRYIFFWTFVAERLPNEPAPFLPADRKSNLTPFDGGEDSHSASWQRWGVLGFILKWALLALSISIPILQILWRIVPQFRRFGVLYMAEATIEIIVSALFILKLFLNVLLSRCTPWWRPLRYYTAPILALVISTGLGIGNLIYFALSETTLGRFLQAVELYILIVFVLITAFYKKSATRSIIRPRKQTTLSFAGLPEKAEGSPFAMSPPAVRTPEPVVSIGPTASPPVENDSSPSRVSATSRLSAWIMSRRFSRRPSSGERQLWNQDEAELGITSPNRQTFTVTGSMDRMSPRVEELKENQMRPTIALDRAPTPQIEDGMTSRPDDSKENRFTSPPRPARATESMNPPFTAFSIPSYYGVDRSSRLSYLGRIPNLRQGADSPVYGLNGIIDRTQNRASDLDPRGSMNSFDELLRQQTELDKSIAALRLFSPQASALTFPPPVPPMLSTQPSDRSTSLSTRSSGVQKPESVSAVSEFSLSIFPEPPVADRNSIYQPTPRSLATLRAQRQSRVRKEDVPTGVVPIGIPDDDTPSLPGSPMRDVISPRFDSAGTQYDVTSFIGDLTVPTGALTGGPVSAFKSAPILSDVESGDESPGAIQSATTKSMTTGRQVLVGSVLPTAGSIPSFGPASASSGVLTSAESRGLKPLLLAASTPIGPSPLSVPQQPPRNPSEPPFPAFGARRSRGGLPTRPRLAISGPRPPPQDGRGDQAPGAFERPRPPPLVLEQRADKLERVGAPGAF